MTPRRTIKGSVWKKGPTWWFGFPLKVEHRAKTTLVRYVARVPDRTDGAPMTEAYATKFKDSRVFAYQSGQWDPFADAVVVSPGAPKSVRDFAREWLRGITNASAVGDRRWFEKFIAPSELASMLLSDVRPRHVATFIAGLREMPSGRGGKLAPRSIRNVYSVLHRMFVNAVFNEALPASPAMLPRGVMPKIVDKDPLARRTWIRDWPDVEMLISSPIVPPDRRVLYALEHLTGARFSECAAARWMAWDRKRKPLGCLSIAYSRDLHSGEDKPTKSNVPREVPVHPRLAAIMNEWWSTGWEAHYGRAPTENDRIVPTRSFDARDPRNNWTRHAEDCKKLGIRRTRQHDARRTFISALREAEVPSHLVGWMTHGREQTVQGSYTDVSWKSLCAAVEKLPIRVARAKRSATTRATWTRKR